MNIYDFLTNMELKNAFPIVIHLEKEKFNSSNLYKPLKKHTWVYDISNKKEYLKFIKKFGSYSISHWHGFEISTKESGNIKVFYISTSILI